MGRYRSLPLTAARATAHRCMAVARDAAQMVLCRMPQTSYAPPVFCVHRHSAESWTALGWVACVARVLNSLEFYVAAVA